MDVDWSKQRVILTGGAGFLGQEVQRVLRERGVSEDRLVIPQEGNHVGFFAIVCNNGNGKIVLVHGG